MFVNEFNCLNLLRMKIQNLARHYISQWPDISHEDNSLSTNRLFVACGKFHAKFLRNRTVFLTDETCKLHHTANVAVQDAFVK